MSEDGLGELTIRAPREGDFEAWFALYQPYALAVESPVTPSIAEVMWQWILRNEHRIEAIVAERDGELVGFAHFRPFPRTLDANEACFLDDLFVADGERGKGTAVALIERLKQISSARGWTHVRWVTGEENKRAQRFYNKFAEDMKLLTYRVF